MWGTFGGSGFLFEKLFGGGVGAALGASGILFEKL